MKILILCTGNSCRSQMASAYLQSLDSKIAVFSAGTHPSQAVNPIAVKVMAEIGIDISHNVPKNVDLFIGQSWDYVITVCDGANESCPVFSGDVKRRLHIGFDDPAMVTGTSAFVEGEFRRVRDEIKTYFTNLYLNELLVNETK